jgi:predicted RNase H-like HicB family nuclease
MVVQWSDEDQAYVVSIPEFGPYCKTHGESYAAAVERGVEVIEGVIATYDEEGWPLPPPAKYTPEAASPNRPGGRESA